MRVLVGCEFSGRVRDEFLALGHDAWSCDLLPTTIPGPHIQADVRDVLGEGWDLGIFHPPCTYSCNSGVRWLYGGKGSVVDPARWQQMEEGAAFFRELIDDPRIAKSVGENPIMHRYAQGVVGRPHDQLVQPWQFGHQEMKATCFWLRGVPPLLPTAVVGPPPTDPVERRKWAKVHQASPGPDRWAMRSLTYTGIARAMAEQWGGLVTERKAG